jgi:hypothetical protein
MSWICRAGSADVTFPKVASAMLPSAGPRLEWLKTFRKSKRNWRLPASPSHGSECRNPHHLIRVLQFDLVAPIGSEAGAPIHAEDLHIETLAIDAHDQVVIGVRTAIHSGLNKML